MIGWQVNFIGLLAALALGGTVSTTGLQSGVFNFALTVTTVCFVIGFAATLLFRSGQDLPLLPSRLLREPAVIAIGIYYSIGILSGIVAADKDLYLREIVQRSMIIWVPLYLFSCGLRRAEQVKNMFLAYLVSGGCVALGSALAGAAVHFSSPVYLWGMHKNHIAGSCATLAVVSIAFLLTSGERTKIWALTVPTKPFFIALISLGVVGIVGAQGRAGIISVIVATYVMMLSIRTRPALLIKVGAAAAATIGLILKVLPEKAIEHVYSTGLHSANAVRMQLWTEMIDRVMHNPLLASGWGNPYIDEKGYFYYDLANVLLFDWMQMSFFGAIALLAMMFFAVKLGVDNATRVQTHSMLGFANLAATGMVAARFTHGMLDTFWIGRGIPLQTFIGVGTLLFVKLLLDTRDIQARSATVSPVRRREPAGVPR